MGEPQRKKLLSASKPPILRDIEAVRYETIHTSTTLPMTEDRVLIFDVPAQKGFYIDLSQLKYHVCFRVKRKNGSTVNIAADKVAFQSAILYTMFKDLQVNFNHRTVFWGRFLYGYYANLLLQFKIPGNERKMLASSVYQYDDSSDLVPVKEKREEEKEDGTKNVKWLLTGYSGEDIVDNWGNRTGMNNNSQELEVMGNVLFDLSFQNRLLRDDIDLRFSYTPQNPHFSLLAGTLNREYVIEITQATMHVPRISVRPSSALPPGEISYYFVEHRMLAIPVLQGTSNFDRTITSGPLPRRLIMSQILEESHNGDLTKSCFRFPHFKISSIQVMAGATRVPTDPLTMDWDGEDVLRPYLSLFANMKNSLGFTGLSMSRDEFAMDRTYFAMDCTRDMEAGSEHWVQGSSGNLSLSIRWKEALEKNIVLLICLEYEKVCTVDRLGQAEVDFAPLYN